MLAPSLWPKQDAAPQADRVEQLRHHLDGIALHVVERTRQRAPATNARNRARE